MYMYVCMYGLSEGYFMWEIWQWFVHIHVYTRQEWQRGLSTEFYIVLEILSNLYQLNFFGLKQSLDSLLLIES